MFKSVQEKLRTALEPEQLEFYIQTGGISGEFAVCAYHAVAGDDYRNGVVTHGTAHRPRRSAQPAGDVSVGRELSAGYIQQLPPDAEPELAAARGEREPAGVRALSGK